MIPIRQKLVERGYSFEMTGRSKSIYSIYYKMQHKGVPFSEIYDLQAIRIVFDPDRETTEKEQCWKIYSLITDVYRPKPDRIRDWVSMPKANGYEALHITVMGTDGKWVEVQIRTQRMNDIAEKGYAAHWKYKGVAEAESELDKWLRNVRELLHTPNADTTEFIDNFKTNLFAHEILVFTPKGQIKTLPQKATALDFAYEIHSEIGQKAIAAKVNHKLLPLNHELHSGDQVEIITSDMRRTQHEWLDHVVTAKARSSIRNNINAENRNRVEKGKTILEERLNTCGVMPNSRVMRKLLDAYETKTKDELYGKIGAGLLQLNDLPKILKRNSQNKWIRYWSLQLFGPKGKPAQAKGERMQKKTDGQPELNYRIAKCCNPIPGDDVIGYQNPHDDVILIHKSRCPNAVILTANRSEQIVPVKWATIKMFSFLAKIAIQGIDRPDIYFRITACLIEQLNINIRTFNMASHDGIFEGTIELYVHDTGDLDNLMKRLNELKGVESIKRLEILDQQKETLY
jgi:GTP pyrophosphokinase